MKLSNLFEEDQNDTPLDWIVRSILYRYAIYGGENLSEIIMKYLPASKTYEGGDILDCQSELIDAGFEEFAKL